MARLKTDRGTRIGRPESHACPAAKNSMNGESMPAPAPCASAMVLEASEGPVEQEFRVFHPPAGRHLKTQRVVRQREPDLGFRRGNPVRGRPSALKRAVHPPPEGSSEYNRQANLCSYTAHMHHARQHRPCHDTGSARHFDPQEGFRLETAEEDDSDSLLRQVMKPGTPGLLAPSHGIGTGCITADSVTHREPPLRNRGRRGRCRLASLAWRMRLRHQDLRETNIDRVGTRAAGGSFRRRIQAERGLFNSSIQVPERQPPRSDKR